MDTVSGGRDRGTEDRSVEAGRGGEVPRNNTGQQTVKRCEQPPPSPKARKLFHNQKSTSLNFAFSLSFSLPVSLPETAAAASSCTHCKRGRRMRRWEEGEEEVGVEQRVGGGGGGGGEREEDLEEVEKEEQGDEED